MNLKNAVAVIMGRDHRRLTEAARVWGVDPIHTDAAVEADVERRYREVLQQSGHLDILVNNARIDVFKSRWSRPAQSFGRRKLLLRAGKTWERTPIA